MKFGPDAIKALLGTTSWDSDDRVTSHTNTLSSSCGAWRIVAMDSIKEVVGMNLFRLAIDSSFFPPLPSSSAICLKQVIAAAAAAAA